MSVTLTWGSAENVRIGTVNFSTERRIKSLKGVLSYGYSGFGVAGETDAFIMEKEDKTFHDLPVEWDGPDSYIEFPHGRLVLLSLPYVLKEVVQRLGLSNSTGDALWVLSFDDNTAQIGSDYHRARAVVELGELGSLVVDPTK